MPFTVQLATHVKYFWISKTDYADLKSDQQLAGRLYGATFVVSTFVVQLQRFAKTHRQQNTTSSPVWSLNRQLPQNTDCFRKITASFLTICEALRELILRGDSAALRQTLQACVAFRVEVETRPERNAHRGQVLNCLVIQSH